jgi:hypothetical protein
MRFSWWTVILMVLWIGLTLIVLVAEPVAPVRAPLLIGLLVVGGAAAYAVSVLSEFRRSPDEVQAEAMMREQQPGAEHLPEKFRAEWNEEERLRQQRQSD